MPPLARSCTTGVAIANATALTAALTSATGGEVLELAPGNYGQFVFSIAKTFSPAVRIRSADPSNMAVFETLQFASAVNGVHIHYVECNNYNNVGLNQKTIYIEGTSSVQQTDYEIKYCDIHASLTDAWITDIDEWNSRPQGIYIRYTDNVKIIGNKIHHLASGIGFTRGSDIIINRNVFSDNRIDSTNFASLSNFEYGYNIAYRSHPNVPYGYAVNGDKDHPDKVVQYWTFGETEGSKWQPVVNVNIHHNIGYSGGGVDTLGGKTAEQCFLLQNEGGLYNNPAEPDPGPYNDVTIAQNIACVNAVHGISFNTHCVGVTISRNTVIPYPVSQSSLGAATINANGDHVIDGLIEYNVSPPIGGTILTKTGNYEYSIIDPVSAAYVASRFLGYPSLSDPRHFLPVPGTAHDFGSGLGAEETLAPYALLTYAYSTAVQTFADPAAPFTVAFEAIEYQSLSNPVYQWNFGDGNTATGASVSHAYAADGEYTYTLTITDDNGVHDVWTNDVWVQPMLYVDIDGNGQLQNKGRAASRLTWTGTLDYTTGSTGNAFAVNTSLSDYCRVIAPGAAMSGWRKLTAACTFKLTSIPGTSAIGLMELQGAWSLYAAGTGVSLNFAVSFDDTTGATLTKTGLTLNDGQFHTVLVNYDDATDTAQMWLDGTKVAEATNWTAGPLKYTTSYDLYVGRRSNDSVSWSGTLEDIVIARCVLTPSTIAAALSIMRAALPANWGGRIGLSTAGGTITGSSLDEIFIAVDGQTTFTGGGGANTYRYTATTQSPVGTPDTITDFTHGTDQLDISAIATGYYFVGQDAFSGTYAEMRVTQSGADALVELDTDKDGVAEMAWVLTGVTATTITDADIIGAKDIR